jgi:tetratricopeptide (TPR) repeat protein
MSLTQAVGEQKTALFRGLFVSRSQRMMVLSLVLCALTLVLYEPLKDNRFLDYDDHAFVSENPHVASGLSWNNVLWAFANRDTAEYWKPLTWVSHMLDCTLFGLNPAGHHLMNVFLHTINVVLVFFVLQRGTGFVGRSFFLALLFAVHPLNTQTVAWVAERKNLLCALFWLLTIWAYGWYALNRTWKRYLAVAGLFLLAIMSKPMAVTLPCVLLLLDYWPLRRIQFHGKAAEVVRNMFRLALEKLPLVPLIMLSSVMTWRATNRGVIDSLHLPLGFRIENALISYWAYVSKAFWPVHLALWYPYPEGSIPWWKITLAALFIVLTTVFTVRMSAKGYLLVGWLWFLGTLVPVLGLVQVGSQAMADRYMYIPIMGILLMVVWLVADGTKNLTPRGRAVVVSIAAGVLVALSAGTRHELAYWHDSVTIWARSIEVTGDTMEGNMHLGYALLEANRRAEALIQFRHALADNPQVAAPHSNIAVALMKVGMLKEAVEQSDLALALMKDEKDKAHPYNNRAIALMELGRNAEAESDFKEAIRIAPDSDTFHLNYGTLLQKEGRFQDAVFQFGEAVKLAPSNLAYCYLGQALQHTNRLHEALAAYQQALKITPGMIEAQQGIESIQHILAQPQDARHLKER